MFCSKCGNQLPGGAVVCPKCGEKVEKASFSGLMNHTEQKSKQIANDFQNQARHMTGGVQSQVQNLLQSYKQQQENRKIKDVHEMFVRPDEEEKAVIGREYLDSLIHKGMSENGFGVLTGCRLYYRGKCYHKSGGHHIKADEERTVDIQDITSSGFTYNHYPSLKKVAICTFVLFIYFLYDYNMEGIWDASGILSFFSFIISGCTFLAYMFLQTAMYEITFAGGSIGIKVSSYSIKELKAFDKALRVTKDEYLAKSR